MSIGTWEPDQASALDAGVVRELLAAAGRLEEEQFGFDAAAVGRLAGVAREDRELWRAAVAGLASADLIALARLFTLAEGRLPGWEAGAKSPVVVIARELRARGDMAGEVTAWIKANTTNRFLPYGSLLDRL